MNITGDRIWVTPAQVGRLRVLKLHLVAVEAHNIDVRGMGSIALVGVDRDGNEITVYSDGSTGAQAEL